jgi:hypothetical protein
MPNPNDYALVVGINDYRALDPLDGAKKDADAFVKWLLDPLGGDVPEDNVKVFLSTKEPWSPGLEEIVDWMIELVEEKSPALDERIGRRMYLFMAGHGIGPGVEEAGLLTPTTSSLAVKYLAGSRYADFFRETALFEEVLLFMDCCRDHDWELPAAYFPLKRKPDAAAGHAVLTMYAFATGFGRKARERDFGDGDGVSGVFTRALLDGLRCGGAEPDGRITAESLKRYVERRVRALRLPGTDQEPFVKVPKDFVLRQGCPPPAVEVTLDLTYPDRDFAVLDPAGGLATVPVAVRVLDDGRRAIDLQPGRIYIFQVLDGGVLLSQSALEVKDEGVNHVRL